MNISHYREQCKWDWILENYYYHISMKKILGIAILVLAYLFSSLSLVHAGLMTPSVNDESFPSCHKVIDSQEKTTSESCFDKCLKKFYSVWGVVDTVSLNIVDHQPIVEPINFYNCQKLTFSIKNNSPPLTYLIKYHGYVGTSLLLI